MIAKTPFHVSFCMQWCSADSLLTQTACLIERSSHIVVYYLSLCAKVSKFLLFLCILYFFIFFLTLMYETNPSRTLECLDVDVGLKPGFFSFIVVYERRDEVESFFPNNFFFPSGGFLLNYISTNIYPCICLGIMYWGAEGFGASYARCEKGCFDKSSFIFFSHYWVCQFPFLRSAIIGSLVARSFKTLTWGIVFLRLIHIVGADFGISPNMS